MSSGDHQQDCPDSTDGKDSVVITAVAKIYEPYTTKCFMLEKCDYRGIEADLLAAVVKELGFQVRFHNVTDYTETVYMFLNGSADVTATTHSWDKFKSINPAVYDRMDIGPPMIDDHATFLVNRKKTNPLSANLLFNVTDKRLWFAFVTVFIGIWFLQKIISSLFCPWAAQSHRTELAKTAWYLMLAIVLGVYSNFLSISLSQPIALAPLFGSLDEYAQILVNGQCKIVLSRVVQENSNLGIMNLVEPKGTVPWMSDSTKTKLLKAHRTNRPILVHNYTEIAEVVSSSAVDKCYIGIVYNSQAKLLLEDNYRKLHNIKLREITPKYYSFMIRRDSPLKEPLRTYLMHGDTTELYRKSQRKYIQHIRSKQLRLQTNTRAENDHSEVSALDDENDETDENDDGDHDDPDDSLEPKSPRPSNNRPLSIRHLMDLFWLSIGCVIIASVSLLTELLVCQIMNKLRHASYTVEDPP